MRSSTWRLEDLRNVILNLGFVGENLHTRQIFDCKKMFDQYPNASVSMTVTPPDGEPYPGTIERDGDLVIWDVRDSDLVAEGDGEIQLVFTQEPHIARSYNARTHICRSQVPTGSIPSGLDDYITRADQLLDQVEDTFPAGGTTGQVLAKKSDTDYDTEWVDQGGGTEDYDELENRPQIGGVTLTGNKTLHDLGAASEEDVAAKYTKPETGIPASDMAAGVIPDPEDLIDDNAGAGDTDKVWSADKSADTASSLMTEINSKADEPTGTKSAGKVYGLDSNLNPVWINQSGGGGGSADIDAIKTELDFVNGSKDLLAGATYYDNKKIDDTGAVVNQNGYEVYEVSYDGTYSTISATVYSNSNYLLKAISFVNSQGTALSVLQYPSTSGASVFTDQAIPTCTAKIYIANKKSLGTASATKPVEKSQRLEDIEQDIEENAEEISDVAHALTLVTKNLFDHRTSMVGLIGHSNGVYYPSETEHTSSDFIPVEPNTIYTISARNKNKLTPGDSGARYAIYDSSKTYITGEKEILQFRTPSNAAYVRFSMNTTMVENMQIERRSFGTKYVPYGSYDVADESDEMFLNYPHNIFTVNGLQYNLYLFNVVPEQYEGQFYHNYYKNDTKMHEFGRFLRIEDNHTATTEQKIIAFFRSMSKVATKEFVITPCDSSQLDNVSVLILGDSTTANGYVAQFLHEFSGNENKITTLGTLGTAPYNHEGRSGWRFENYFTQSQNNPFYNPSTQTFDAEYYFSQTGVDVPDLFIINLGINDMHYNAGSLYEAKQTADIYISRVNAVIESLRSVDANIKVAICMTIPPNVDPWGFGSSGTNIIGYDQYRIANLVLCDKLIDAFDYRESEGLYLIPINVCIDTKYNMPTSAQLPNSRAEETIMEPDSAGGVHPNTGGYHQIADMIYAFLCGTFKTT